MLTGCQQPETRQTAAPPTMPATEVRQRYNQRANRIERFWSHAVVEVEWVDAEGDRHFEQGDGPLIVRKPDELALAIGKLGNTIIWIGRDAQRYWLFELEPPKDEPSTAYVGEIAELDELAPEQLPLPLPPDQLITLLGITPLPDDVRITPATTGSGTYQAIEPAVPGQPRRYWRLDQRLRPIRIGFLAPDSDEVVAEAQLSNYRDLKLVNQPPGAWPYIAGQVQIRVPRQRAKVSLFVSDATNNPDKFRDAQFDFDRLIRALRPQRVRHIRPGEPDGRSQQ